VFGSALQFHILQFQLVNKLPTTGCYDVAVDKLISSSFVGLVGESVVVQKISWSGKVPPSSPGLRQDLKGKSAGKSHLTGEDLVYIGHGSYSLAVPAAKAFWLAEADVGAPIWLVSAYRTKAQQVQLYIDKPTLAVPQGRSYHEKGRAVDVNRLAGPREFDNNRAALRKYGWSGIKSEDWHYNFLN
jgi:D-alanyl-D-alanine dipeptidase